MKWNVIPKPAKINADAMYRRCTILFIPLPIWEWKVERHGKVVAFGYGRDKKAAMRQAYAWQRSIL